MLSRGDNTVQTFHVVNGDNEKIGEIKHTAPCVFRAYYKNKNMAMEFIGASSSLQRAQTAVEKAYYG